MSKTRTKPRNTMAPRMRNSPNPGMVILQATRKRLYEQFDNRWWEPHSFRVCAESIILIDLCISRVNSSLEV